MKSKILIPLFIGVAVASCSKKDGTAVNPKLLAPAASVVLTGEWKAGTQQDVVTSSNPGITPVSTSTDMPFSNWEFREDGTLNMGNGSSNLSMKFSSLPGNKIVLTFRNIQDTMEILPQESNRIVLKEVKKRLDGKILTETLQLFRKVK
jgi:hypothetical protein